MPWLTNSIYDVLEAGWRNEGMTKDARDTRQPTPFRPPSLGWTLLLNIAWRFGVLTIMRSSLVKRTLYTESLTQHLAPQTMRPTPDRLVSKRHWQEMSTFRHLLSISANFQKVPAIFPFCSFCSYFFVSSLFDLWNVSDARRRRCGPFFCRQPRPACYDSTCSGNKHMTTAARNIAAHSSAKGSIWWFW